MNLSEINKKKIIRKEKDINIHLRKIFTFISNGV